MPAANDYLTALNQQHPDINLMGNSTFQGYANSAAGQGMSTNDFVTKYNSDPGIFSAYNQKYQTMAQPQIDSITGQIKQQGDQMALSDQSTANSGNTVNNDAGNAERNIRVQGIAQGDSIANAADRSGIGNAGTTLVGQANNSQDVTRNISYTEANRANSLAQLAIQNSATKAGIQGSIDNLQGQEGAINYNTAQNAQGDYNQDSATMFNRDNTLFNDSLALPAGRTANIGPGFTVNGTKIDANGAVTAIQNLLPVLGQPGVQSLLSSILPQFGISLTPDQIKQFAAPAPAAKPSYSGGGGGSYGGGGGGYQAPQPQAQQAPQQDQAPQYGPGRSGAPLAEENQVTPYLANFFRSGGQWQGQDQQVMSKLINRFSLSPSQASYMYYTTRKALLGQ